MSNFLCSFIHSYFHEDRFIKDDLVCVLLPTKAVYLGTLILEENPHGITIPFRLSFQWQAATFGRSGKADLTSDLPPQSVVIQMC